MTRAQAGLATDDGVAAAAATRGTEIERCAKILSEMCRWPSMYHAGQALFGLETIEQKLYHPIEYENAAAFAKDVKSLFDVCQPPSGLAEAKLLQARAKFEKTFHDMQLSTDQGAAAAAAAAAAVATRKKRKHV
jgi:hypothetical protein